MIYTVVIYHIYSIYINAVDMKGYSIFFMSSVGIQEKHCGVVITTRV